MNVTIAGKEYTFKKPVLSIARKAAKLDKYFSKETSSQELNKMLQDDEAFKVFCDVWKEFYEAALEKPSDELTADKLSISEVIELLGNFMSLMGGGVKTSPVGSETSTTATQ